MNPAMHTSCGVLRELIPKLLHTTLGEAFEFFEMLCHLHGYWIDLLQPDVTIDVFERQRHGKALPDLLKYGCYEILVI